MRNTLRKEEERVGAHDMIFKLKCRNQKSFTIEFMGEFGIYTQKPQLLT